MMFYTQCSNCLHTERNSEGCKAFPKGIPAEVFENEISHFHPIDGDNGFTWKATKPGDKHILQQPVSK